LNFADIGPRAASLVAQYDDDVGIDELISPWQSQWHGLSPGNKDCRRDAVDRTWDSPGAFKQQLTQINPAFLWRCWLP
jgi:hypothetical protein